MALTPDTPAPPVSIEGDGELRATIKTSLGNLYLRLFEKEAPRTVANFVALATGAVEWTNPAGQKSTAPFYNGTIIHRVIPEFMIQMGCPEGTGRGNPGWRFGDEFAPGLRHDRGGLLSMANAGPNTNGSQFFVTEVPTPHLDGRHAIFGELVDPSDIDIIRKIARVPTAAGNRPRQPIVVEAVDIYRA